MFCRFIARWWGKRAYVWKLEVEAATNDINAKLSANLANEKRELVEQLNKEADAIEANIKKYSEMEANGFWVCEKGHEKADSLLPTSVDKPERTCLECGAIAKYIRRDLMAPKERYDSEQERKEAEKVVASKRQLAAEETKNVSGGEATAQHFRGMANNSRIVADRIRRL
jgi:hypothetical protein